MTAEVGATPRSRVESFLRQNWFWIFFFSYVAKWIYLFHQVDFHSEFPLVNTDYIQYYARVLRILEFLKHGRYWGYDPYEMAGYPAVLREIGSYFMAVIAHGLAGICSAKTAVLLCEIGGHVLAPLLIIPAVQNFGGSRNNALIGFAILSVMYGGMNVFSSIVLTQGIFGFMMGCFVAVWNVSLFWRWLIHKEWSIYAWFLIASVVLPQLHPAAVIIVVAPVLLMLVMSVRSMRIRDVAQLAVVIAITIASNLYWLRPYLHYAGWIDILEYWKSGGMLFIQSILPIQATWLDFIRALAHLLLLGLLVVSLRSLFHHSKPSFNFFLSWICWLAVIVFWGHHLPLIKTLQPARYVFSFWLVILLAMAVAFDPSVYTTKMKITLVQFMGVALIAGWYQTVYGLAASLPLFSTHLSASEQLFLDEVRTSPPFSGRLLLECGYRQRPNIADITAVLSKQPLLGGHDPGNFLKSRFTVFGAIDTDAKNIDDNKKPIAFGRPLIKFENDETLFANYLRLYNVTQIAAWSERTVKILNRFSKTLTIASKKGEYTMYAVRRSPSWFVQGSGSLTMDYDQLTIQNPSAGTLVLKCHWIDSFKSDPPLPISPVYLMDDPVPFIQIENQTGAKHIVIFNTGHL